MSRVFVRRAHIRPLERKVAPHHGAARDQQLRQRHSRHSEWNCLAPRSCFPSCLTPMLVMICIEVKCACNDEREKLYTLVSRESKLFQCRRHSNSGPSTPHRYTHSLTHVPHLRRPTFPLSLGFRRAGKCIEASAAWCSPSASAKRTRTG